MKKQAKQPRLSPPRDMKRQVNNHAMTYDVSMVGIQYLTDEDGRKVAVQIDLAKHGQLWEDFQDAIVANSRRKERGIPIEKLKASLLKSKTRA